MYAHQSADDPDCPCGHLVRLHSHRFGCSQCDCGHNTTRTSPTERHAMSALTKAYVATLPKCDIHKYDLGDPNVDAKYDAKTKGGPWASMCESCWKTHRHYPDLGTGKGQEYVLGEPPARDRLAESRAALEAGDFDAALDALGDGDPADFF